MSVILGPVHEVQVKFIFGWGVVGPESSSCPLFSLGEEVVLYTSDDSVSHKLVESDVVRDSFDDFPTISHSLTTLYTDNCKHCE